VFTILLMCSSCYLLLYNLFVHINYQLHSYIISYCWDLYALYIYIYMPIINLSHVILPNYICPFLSLHASFPASMLFPSTYPSPPPVSRVNIVTKWEEEHEDYLIDILREFLEEGTRPPYGKKLKKKMLILPKG
jgi:hypothetical protein